MESYIVRIYRREQDMPARVVGIVQDVESRQEHAFSTLEELRDILGQADNLRDCGEE